MIYKLYSIHDLITDTYSLPFHSLSDHDAMRSVRLAAVAGSKLLDSCQDFNLYFIGSFDDSTGCYISQGSPTFLERVFNIVNPSSEV